jgi:hypothetical protein
MFFRNKPQPNQKGKMAKQASDLPGMVGEGVESPSIKAVDAAFDTLLGARNNRMKWAGKEKEAQTILIGLFHDNKLKSYNYDDRVYILADIEKIRLKPKDEEEAE